MHIAGRQIRGIAQQRTKSHEKMKYCTKILEKSKDTQDIQESCQMKVSSTTRLWKANPV